MKTTRFLPVILIIVAALVAVPSAGAAPGSIEQDWVIAEAFWSHRQPECSTITRGETVIADGRIGEATQTYPGYDGPCVFNVVPGLSLEAQCVIVVHEYGHLIGEKHSTDPTNVMYPNPVRASVPACALPPVPVYAPASQSEAAAPPSVGVPAAHHRRRAPRHRRFVRGEAI